MYSKTKYQELLKTLGPGILFASTAIGVSHLVQSTRAGSEYGFALLWAVILANVLKYPFFEYGSRYANANNESIIDGYQRINNWVLIAYFVMTIFSMFFVTAAVGFVTAGFLENIFGINTLLNFKFATVILLFVICCLLLIFGQYKLLDSLIKIIGALLLISTLLAFVLTLIKGPVAHQANFVAPPIWDDKGILFIVAVMGWMPTAVDLSTWNSLWTIERIKQTGYKPSMKQTLYDFNFGYWVSGVLSICFVTLGAYLVYGSGIQMPEGSAAFANKVVSLYTATIGEWSYLIIAISAFSIMFGTSIAVFDGYARSLQRCVELLFYPPQKQEQPLNNKNIYTISLLLLATGALIIIVFFTANLKQLVDLATTISFLIAPLVAFVNFRLVTHYISPQHQPPKWLRLLSWLGLIYLLVFSLLFLSVQFA